MSEELPVRDRHLLMIATGRYSDPNVWEELDVDRETRVWRDWLTDPGLGERAFTVVFEDLAHSPGADQLDALVRQRTEFDKDRDVVVCYITGHGEQHERTHHLVLSTSRPNAPDTMWETPRLLKWLKARVSTALVVVDTCYAGDVAAYFASLDEDLPDGWLVIAAASAYQQARLGALTQAVREFAAGGAADSAFPYLQFIELFKVLSTALHGQRWKLLTTPPQWTDRLACLPNSHYRADVDERVVVGPARQDVAMYAADLVAHWDPRSRGVGDASAAGVLFTGRDHLMRVLIDAARGGPGALVVTGVAGCGKSAALSRLVTFSDPGFRARYADAVDAAAAAGEPLPGVGDVDLAVLAKGLVTRGVVGAIRDRLAIPLVDGETTAVTVARIHRLRAGSSPVTLVLDALDEAQDPRGIVREVLAPLLHPPGGAAWLRLLVGVRGTAPYPDASLEGASGLAAATIEALSATTIDAAAPPYWTSGDLAGYVARLLLVPLDGERSTPYADATHEDVTRVARAVAGIAGTSYVLARLISDQLRRQPHRQDPDDPAWQASARAGLADILDAELVADYPHPRQRARARALLTAASLSHGRGVPRRDIWPAVAGALDPTGGTVTDADIVALLDEHVGGYLIRDVAENATVYRPFHDALADTLTGPIDQTTRRRVTTALLQLVTATRTNGLVVPPSEYVRRHLVEHAADSGDLDQLIHHPDVLAWTYPDHLLPLLSQLRDPDAQQIGRIYRTVAHTLRHPEGPPDTFALQLRARQAGLGTLADQLANTTPHQAVRLRWATPHQDSDHQRIDTPADVTAVATTTLPDGTRVIVAGGDDGAVRVWRLVDGAPVVGPLRGHDSSVRSVAVGTLQDGTPVAVAGSDDGAVRVWRLVDGAPVGKPLRRSHGGGVKSVAVGTLPGGTPVVVSGGDDDGAVRVWRLVDGAPVGKPLRRSHGGLALSVAVGTLPDGTPVVVSGGDDDGTVRVWRLADGTPVGEPLRSYKGRVTSVAVGTLPDGTPAVVSGSHDGTVRMWRLADGKPVGGPLRGHESSVASVAVGTLLDGTPVLVSGSNDWTVRVWRLADGAPVGEPLPGHNGRVTSVAVGMPPSGTPVVVSGSWDGTVRVWRPVDGAPVGEPLRGHNGWVTAVAVGVLPDGTPVVVSGSSDQTVRVWRPVDGAPVGKPLRGRNGRVTAVAVGVLPGGTPVVVSGSYDDGTMRVWRLADGKPVGSPLRGHDDLVRSVAVGVLPNGTPVVVSGSWDGTVRVWRLAYGTQVGKPLRGHDGRVTSVAVGTLSDGTPVIVSGSDDWTMRVWRLVDRAPVGEPIRGHHHGVTSVAVATLPDGTPAIVSGSRDGTVRVWRLADGTQVGGPLNLLSTVTAVAATGASIIVATGNDVVALDM